MQRGFVWVPVLVVAGLLVLAGVFAYRYADLKKDAQLKSIDSFEECSKKYPVMESYPAQCMTPDGRHFVQELPEKEKSDISVSSQSATKKFNGKENFTKVMETKWNRYTDNDLGLTFQHPETWRVEIGQNKNSKYVGEALIQRFFIVESDETRFAENHYGLGITVEILANKNNFTLKQWAENHSNKSSIAAAPDQKSIKIISDALIGNLPAIKFTHFTFDYPGDIEVAVLNDNKIYSFVYLNVEAEQVEGYEYLGDYKQVFEKILKSIEFKK